MNTFHTISEIRNWIKTNKLNGKTIGFVPTMGFLHEGHLSLIDAAKRENDLVILSIFVNPLQFGEGEDFEDYPRNYEKDSKLAEEHGVDAIFHPSINEMYPKKMSATITVHEGTDVLCGVNRPGHFDGVATVVMKLFSITTPDKAYFGMKDAQQVAVIERMVSDFHLDLEIVRCPTLRENDGLAKSSRNVYLSEVEREEAPKIYKVLMETKDVILGDMRPSVQQVKQFLTEKLTKELSAKVDYGEVLSFPTLEHPQQLSGELLIAVAVKYSKARLIDNIIINVNEGRD
ncbi:MULTISPECIES: pantoate--beta-alanine ligase [Bacillaceae]|uniref:Pantothenate synthetase n=1 Tax=Evansella alkalicola TaxID=745819 RepID=A0ABS6JZ95_9BACI|nr:MULTISPECIES: pantoate--beta-alanine ligase [Bacillaceae]MBU9723917.1 pantoate--beta-alanine ligase [Bacillus alkalicola]